MLRNREFRQFIIFFFFIATVYVFLGFRFSTAAGILAIASSITFGTLFGLYTRARYKSIARISEQIDLLLHNANQLSINKTEEGELSILQSEISKMMLRIREQNDALKKEKENLANSLADIAHQLRTPLTSANLILSLLANNPDENQQKAFVRETEELLIRMDWLITSLLKLSRLDAGIVVFQREPININNLLKNALRPFLISMELHNIEFQIHAPKEMMIWGDLSWLSEAIQNLFKNSIESIGDNGTIEIICADTPLHAQIEIHDSGKGFNKEDLPHLFNRYYRGKNQKETGYGIGLALCKMIVSHQGGSITAKNHSNGGAVFSIRFPK